jgi:hypothetical protein
MKVDIVRESFAQYPRHLNTWIKDIIHARSSEWLDALLNTGTILGVSQFPPSQHLLLMEMEEIMTTRIIQDHLLSAPRLLTSSEKAFDLLLVEKFLELEHVNTKLSSQFVSLTFLLALKVKSLPLLYVILENDSLQSRLTSLESLRFQVYIKDHLQSPADYERLEKTCKGLLQDAIELLPMFQEPKHGVALFDTLWHTKWIHFKLSTARINKLIQKAPLLSSHFAKLLYAKPLQFPSIPVHSLNLRLLKRR